LQEFNELHLGFPVIYMRNTLFLQVHLTKFPSLPPSFQQTPNAVEELKLASKMSLGLVFLY